MQHPDDTHITYTQDGANDTITGGTHSNVVPTGWIYERALSIVGTPSLGYTSGHYIPSTFIIANGNASQPSVWFSYLNVPVHLENLCFFQPQVGMLLGMDSSGILANGGSVATISFKNVSWNIDQVSTAGPGISMVNAVFEVQFDQCVVSGNTALAYNEDNAAAILVNGSSCGLISFTNGALNGGGIKAYAGSSNGPGLFIKNVVTEAQPENQPFFWMPSPGSNSDIQVTIEFVVISDTVGNNPIVQIDGAQSAAQVVVTSWAGGNAPVGPCTVIGGNPPTQETQVSSTLRNNQSGFASGLNNGVPRFYAQMDHVVRSFTPTLVRFPNIATTSPSGWTTSGTGASITTGIAAPDGTSNAGRGRRAAQMPKYDFWQVPFR